MSVIVFILNDGIDAIVWSSEELEGVVTAIDTRFWYYIQIVKQDTVRFLNGFQSRSDVVSQEADRYTTLAMTPRTICRSRAVDFKQGSRSLRLKPRNLADQPPGASRGR